MDFKEFVKKLSEFDICVGDCYIWQAVKGKSSVRIEISDRKDNLWFVEDFEYKGDKETVKEIVDILDKYDPFEDSLERFLFHNRVTKRYKVRELISICSDIEDEVISFSRWLCEEFRI